jgi:hypothetical protein
MYKNKIIIYQWKMDVMHPTVAALLNDKKKTIFWVHLIIFAHVIYLKISSASLKRNLNNIILLDA